MGARSQHQEPIQQQPKLIVVIAFDPDDEGELRPAIEPLEQTSEMQAKVTAASLSYKHAGVIAWTRTAQPDQGEFGEPIVIFQRGRVPADME